MSVKKGMLPSKVRVFPIELNQTELPEIRYTNGQVQVSSSNKAKIYYSWDGLPTENSLKYFSNER